MPNPVLNYFAEFKVLKSASKDFWLTNVTAIINLLQDYAFQATHSRLTSYSCTVVAAGGSSHASLANRRARRAVDEAGVLGSVRRKRYFRLESVLAGC